MNNSWHPDCFRCDICDAVLADVGFVKNAGRSVPLQPASVISLTLNAEVCLDLSSFLTHLSSLLQIFRRHSLIDKKKELRE